MKFSHGSTSRPSSARVAGIASPPTVPEIPEVADTSNLPPIDVTPIEFPDLAVRDTVNSPDLINDSPVGAEAIYDNGSPEPAYVVEPNPALDEPLAEFVP